ncbi:hypothetical protein [Prosthecomicrobium pneumaticum]|uniref:Uncharacterized protein n=1 Tax=Prosthecomicrobium pneumaticum TaxID=81895 RepID=A0A7W9FJV2_9HYPH|nr:hypothetical protein [Prosthecomicrobium pneumaticum]MBB5751885.1 hypothetical protein [Prosthecomicrobium pneumaticum]
MGPTLGLRLHIKSPHGRTYVPATSRANKLLIKRMIARRLEFERIFSLDDPPTFRREPGAEFVVGEQRLDRRTEI